MGKQPQNAPAMKALMGSLLKQVESYDAVGTAVKGPTCRRKTGDSIGILGYATNSGASIADLVERRTFLRFTNWRLVI